MQAAGKGTSGKSTQESENGSKTAVGVLGIDSLEAWPPLLSSKPQTPASASAGHHKLDNPVPAVEDPISEHVPTQDDMWRVAKGKSTTKGTQAAMQLDVDVKNGFTPLIMSSTLDYPPRSMNNRAEKRDKLTSKEEHSNQPTSHKLG
ncbi:hypothetical protein HAX54_049130 [Datura stramonium]|uniref:Uncharacterized protein n=1 Tax=Datura stramonium TaxID=4076 RepID=A0ABS8SUW9_DATST|nr:hypothetical protein [Datura stramonium]